MNRNPILYPIRETWFIKLKPKRIVIGIDFDNLS